MSTALQAYRHATSSNELKEIERMRSKARHDEAQALLNAELRGEKKAEIKWQHLIDEKDKIIAVKDAIIVAQDAIIAAQDIIIATQYVMIAAQDIIMAEQVDIIAEQVAIITAQEVIIAELQTQLARKRFAHSGCADYKCNITGLSQNKRLQENL